MPTPEHKVKEAIKKILTAHNAWYCMPVGGMLGRRGVPDFLACVNGYFFAIEAKAGNGKLTPLQKVEMEKIARARGVAIVINEDNLNALDRILDDADR